MPAPPPHLLSFLLLCLSFHSISITACKENPKTIHTITSASTPPARLPPRLRLSSRCARTTRNAGFNLSSSIVCLVPATGHGTSRGTSRGAARLPRAARSRDAM